jgi:hypothetical protein
MRQLLIFSFLLAVFVSPLHASIFPIPSVGEAFSGQIKIDPATPVCPPTQCSGLPEYHFFFYGTGADVGNLSLKIADATLNAGINTIMGSTGTDNLWRYFLQTNGQVNINSTQLTTSYISLILYGSTNSTSVLPLDLSSYFSPLPITTNYFYGPNIQVHLVAPDGLSGANYSGPLTSLHQVDELGNFIFGGTVGEVQFFDIPPVATAVPEPSTWAMLLIGFAWIGFAGLSNAQKSEAPIRMLIGVHRGRIASSKC